MYKYVTDWDKHCVGCWYVTPRAEPRVHAGGRFSEAEPCQRHGFLACLLHSGQGMGAGNDVGAMYVADEAWVWE